MAHVAHHADTPKPWSGGDAPFNISWGKMMMWFFLVSDALTFSSLLLYYGATRNTFRGSWADPDMVFNHFPFMEAHVPLLFVSLMTFILIMSSVTMVLAVEAGHRNDKKKVIFWLILTVIGGFMFLGSQAYEWYNFIVGTPAGKDGIIFGANMFENEYGPQQFAQLFFLITGFHGTHVFSGVLLNIMILWMTVKGVFERRGHYEMVEKVGLYWHFVDLVWVFVFTFFYLL